jgi:transposase
MSTTRDALPADVEALRSLIDEQRREISLLHEQVRLLMHHRFGRRSEKTPKTQRELFNEAEQIVDELGAEVDLEAAVEDGVCVAPHTRTPRGRKPLPASLPRVEVVHDLDASEKICPHDGQALEAIGCETSEQLEVIPAKVRVIRHVRPKYACPRCRKGVHIAPLPRQLIPKSVASPSLLAAIAIAKYADALPLYRQESILARSGIELSRATLASWMVKLGDAVQPLINLMREDLLAGSFIGMDETPFQVLKESGKPATSRSWLWVQRGVLDDVTRPLLLYEYDPSRSAEVPKRLLEGFSGYLQSDGYGGYTPVCRDEAIVQVGCWAHARRKFDEAVKGQGRSGKSPKKSKRETKALQALGYIRKLYAIERSQAQSSAEQRKAVRLERSVPVLADLRGWLDASKDSVPPQSLTGKALAYLDTQWDKLVRYLEDGRIPIDNNQVENAIRPFVVGRKNWLFADTPQGARASANLYSLVETARANGLEPHAYLSHVAEKLCEAQTLQDFEALLPHRIPLAHLPPDINDVVA